MAAKNSTPEFAVAQTESESFTVSDEIRDRLRKKTTRGLHKAAISMSSSLQPRADTPKAASACCELYTYMESNYLPLQGKWLSLAGFIPGMPVKIRVMTDCIVITPQNTRELWGCIEGLNVTRISRERIAAWFKLYPGALNETGDVPARS